MNAREKYEAWCLEQKNATVKVDVPKKARRAPLPDFGVEVDFTDLNARLSEGLAQALKGK